MLFKKRLFVHKFLENRSVDPKWLKEVMSRLKKLLAFKFLKTKIAMVFHSFNSIIRPKKAILLCENDYSVKDGDPYGIRTRECRLERAMS